MSVGDEVIDGQHKKLLHQLNELKEELAKGSDMGCGIIRFLSCCC